MKVKIRTTFSFCEGEAYLPVRETMGCLGEQYTQHRRCAYCQGSGEQEKWVKLREHKSREPEELGIVHGACRGGNSRVFPASRVRQALRRISPLCLQSNT